jgi:hypothetical protein
MLRASSVARSISLDAPVVTDSGPNTTSSATRPPNSVAMLLSSRRLLVL